MRLNRMRSTTVCVCGLILTGAAGVEQGTRADDFKLTLAKTASCVIGSSFVTVQALVQANPTSSSDTVSLEWIAYDQGGNQIPDVFDCDTKLKDAITPETDVGSGGQPFFTDTKHVKFGSNVTFKVVGTGNDRRRIKYIGPLSALKEDEDQDQNQYLAAEQTKLRIFDKAVKKKDGKPPTYTISLDGKLKAAADAKLRLAYCAYYRDAKNKLKPQDNMSLKMVKVPEPIKPGKFTVADFDVALPEKTIYPARIVVFAWIDGDDGEDASHDIEIPIYEP